LTDRFAIEVILLVAVPDSGFATRFLTCLYGDKIGFPTSLVAPLSNPTSEAARLLHYCTGLIARREGEGWVEMEQLEIAEEWPRGSKSIMRFGVPYRCIIPEDVIVLSQGYFWKSIGELLSCDQGMYEDHFKILTQMGVKL